MEAASGPFDTLDDGVCYPVSRFAGFGSIDSTSLGLYFRPMKDDAGATFDKVDLTVTSDKHKAVIEAIVDAMSYSKDPFIIVCDENESVFIHPDVTACVNTITAAN